MTSGAAGRRATSRQADLCSFSPRFSHRRFCGAAKGAPPSCRHRTESPERAHAGAPRRHGVVCVRRLPTWHAHPFRKRATESVPLGTASPAEGFWLPRAPWRAFHHHRGHRYWADARRSHRVVASLNGRRGHTASAPRVEWNNDGRLSVTTRATHYSICW